MRSGTLANYSGRDLETLASAIADLRPMPAAALRVLELVDAGESSATELASVINSDTALTASILRLANSAHYGVAREVGTVAEAVVLLGDETVRSSALGSCLMATLHGAHNLDEEAFWRYSMMTAIGAELRSGGTRYPPGRAFTAGVLHNIGLLALDQHRPAELRGSISFARAVDSSLHEAQLERMGFTDNELGGALAERWSLPPDLVEAVRLHRTRRGPREGSSSLAGLVARGRELSESAGLSDGVRWSDLPAKPLPLTWTGESASAALASGGGVESMRLKADNLVSTALAA